MSHRKNRFKATFTEDEPIKSTMSADEDLKSGFDNAQETVRTSYNFGNGLLYDYESNTISVDSTNEVIEGSEKLITSGAVQAALADNGVVYSESERICGRWLDGKTLYEKTCIFNDVTLHNVRESSFTHGIEGVADIFVVEAYLLDTSIDRARGNYINVIGGVTINGRNVMLQWIADDTYIWINSDSFFNASENRTWRVVVRYTKKEG